MRLFILLLFLVGNVSCLSSEEINQSKIYPVSMINLIANTDKYIGKKVSVSGYYDNMGFQLYISKEAGSIMDYRSAISIVSTGDNQELLESCDLQFVTVEGVFILRQNRKYLSRVEKMRSAKTGALCVQSQDSAE